MIRLNARTKLSSSLNMTPDVPILPGRMPDKKGIPHLIVLLVRAAHNRVSHSGVAATLDELRKDFWILRGRQVVKAILSKCVTCNVVMRKPLDQTTGLLPESRCSYSPPFSVTGLDIFGPLFAREHRPKKKEEDKKDKKKSVEEQVEEFRALVKEMEKKKTNDPGPEKLKIWVLLLTCATTRALHLEVLMKIDAPEIVMAIDRFIGRRGVPEVLYSDNAKQFLKADRDIAQQWEEAMVVLQRHAAEKKIVWRKICERVPWWGGFYERQVGSVKRLFLKLVGKARLTVKEIETVLCKVEATLNSRPVTYQYNDHREPMPLTPNDFLIGPNKSAIRPIGDQGEMPTDTTYLELTQRAKYRDLISQQLEERWTEEYLKERSRQFNRKTKIQPIPVGEVVLIKADNVKRQKWTMGVIVETFPSADGITRSVRLRTATEELRRPVQRLCALEINEFDLDADPQVEPASGRCKTTAEGETEEQLEESVQEELESSQPPPTAQSNEVIIVPNVAQQSTQQEEAEPISIALDVVDNAQAGSVENRRGERRRRRREDSNFVYY